MLNRKCFATLGLLILTLLLGFISMHVMQLFTVSKWVGVSVASGILVVMLILTINFHKSRFIAFIVIPINAIANGIAASSLFVYLNKFPPLWHTALLFVALLFLFYTYCVLAKFSFFQNHYVICIFLYTLILIAVGITCLVVVGGAVFVLALLCLIPFFAFLLLLVSKSRDFFELLKSGVYSSFAVLALIILVVILVISQGEALDGLGDGLDASFGGGSVNNKKNPYDYLTPYN